MVVWMRKKLGQLTRQQTTDPQVISYQALRKSIGWLGILLPFVLIMGAELFSGCTTVQPSISHYYYTNMREILVGTLCAVSLFLFCYKGYSKLDSYVSNVAGFFSLGTALFPTNSSCAEGNCYDCQQNVISLTKIPYHGELHLLSAGLLFFTLAMMSVFLFRKSDRSEPDRTPQKRKRNLVFLLCGLVMLGCIILCGIYIFFYREEESTIVLWLEALALVAFGSSWLIKGEAIMEDK